MASLTLRLQPQFYLNSQPRPKPRDPGFRNSLRQPCSRCAALCLGPPTVEGCLTRGCPQGAQVPWSQPGRSKALVTKKHYSELQG